MGLCLILAGPGYLKVVVQYRGTWSSVISTSVFTYYGREADAGDSYFPHTILFSAGFI
jgi:hypothetical protein